jgi:hypothetical protein
MRPFQAKLLQNWVANGQVLGANPDPRHTLLRQLERALGLFLNVKLERSDSSLIATADRAISAKD